MPVTINTNPAASGVKNNLNSSNAMLQKSLNHLSSGLKIVKPSDDAGRLAVSIKRSDAVTNATGAANIAALTQANTTGAIESVATLRATNGAQASQMGFASDMLTINKQNLETANSRIMDVDVASESTNLARANILDQIGSSMLGQANSSSLIALKLIG